MLLSAVKHLYLNIQAVRGAIPYVISGIVFSTSGIEFSTSGKQLSTAGSESFLPLGLVSGRCEPFCPELSFWLFVLLLDTYTLGRGSVLYLGKWVLSPVISILHSL